MNASEGDGGGRYGGPPFRDETIYTVNGHCCRCGGAAMVSGHYGPWCRMHNIERIARIDARFAQMEARFAKIEARFAQLGGVAK